MSDVIQLFKPKFRTSEVFEVLQDPLDSGWTGMGNLTAVFEREWSEYTGVSETLFVSSATAALHLALESAKIVKGWQRGDEVISTPLTFVSTNHVILQSGLVPVLADVDDSHCLDPESVISRISPRTKALIFVGMGGNAGRLREIAEICRARGIFLILDGAHMAGTRLLGRDAGQFCDVACYSFQAVKNLPTADAGAVCSPDADLLEVARKLSWLGISKDTFARASAGVYAWKYDVEFPGYKYNGNSVMAAMALVGLKYLDEDNKERRRLSDLYRASLGPESDSNFEYVHVDPECVSAQHLFQIRTARRDEVIRVLQENSVFPGVHYRTNTEYPMYRNQRSFSPRATMVSDRVVSLPLHLFLSDDDVVRIADIVKQVVNS